MRDLTLTTEREQNTQASAVIDQFFFVLAIKSTEQELKSERNAGKAKMTFIKWR